jgi:hypothetical protein
MRPYIRPVSLGLSISVAAVLAPLAPVRTTTSGAQAGEVPETLVLNFRGTGVRQDSATQRFVYTADLYDTPGGRRVGTATADVQFISPLTLDHVITFHLPAGDLVDHAVEAIAPDASRQGHYLIGIHPEADTIVAGRGTGAYAGRTGHLTMSGWHDGSKFPQQDTFNDFYLIELNPAS